MLNGLMMAASGIVRSFSVTASSEQELNVTTYTYSSVSLGPAAAGRVIAVLVSIRDNTGSLTLDSASINGESATIIFATAAGSNMTGAAIVYAAVPSGATGDIVLTFNGACLATAIDVVAMYGLSSSTPEASGTDAAIGATRSVTGLAVSKNAIVCAVTGMRNGITVSWSGLVDDASEIRDEQYGSGNDYLIADAVKQQSAADASGSVTATYSSSPIQAALAVASFY